MKKLLSLVVFAGMMSFYACGPGADEKAAEEKRVQDSIAAADSAMKAAEAAAAAAAAVPDTMPHDSTAMADTTKKM